MIRITVTTHGEPDVTLVRRYQFENDDGVLAASAGRIRESLESGRLININEAFMLFVVYVVKSLTSGKDLRRIEEGVRGLLSRETVMIGVAEMMRSIKFDVEMDGHTSHHTIYDPICMTQTPRNTRTRL